jgi:acetate kinase
VRSTIAAYAANVGGIDALVFTGGIGEHSARVRAEICQSLGFIGIHLDEQANAQHLNHINAANSIPVLVIAADEEQEIANLTLTQLDGSNS